MGSKFIRVTKIDADENAIDVWLAVDKIITIVRRIPSKVFSTRAKTQINTVGDGNAHYVALSVEDTVEEILGRIDAL